MYGFVCCLLGIDQYISLARARSIRWTVRLKKDLSKGAPLPPPRLRAEHQLASRSRGRNARYVGVCLQPAGAPCDALTRAVIRAVTCAVTVPPVRPRWQRATMELPEAQDAPGAGRWSSALHALRRRGRWVMISGWWLVGTPVTGERLRPAEEEIWWVGRTWAFLGRGLAPEVFDALKEIALQTLNLSTVNMLTHASAVISAPQARLTSS